MINFTVRICYYNTYLNFGRIIIGDPNNLRLNAVEGDVFEDLCDGDRYARIQASLPKGCSPLTSILFFDEIQRDAKGFVSGEGIIIVGGVFSKQARESRI
jgi:hypothetical protein